jgi:RNA polymerase sigma-70 factor (ECF subfamily)
MPPKEVWEKQTKTDQDVFIELYQTYYERVFAYLLYRTGETHSAQDLTSQVFERVFKNYYRYKNQDSPFEAWLFTIARNLFIDWLRAVNRKKWIPWEWVKQHDNGQKPLEDCVIQNEERLRLQRAIKTLSPRENELLALKFGARLTNRKISAITAISEQNVAVILFRTVGKLRMYLLEEENQYEVNHD